MTAGTAVLRIRGSVAQIGLIPTLRDLTLRAVNRVLLLKILNVMAVERVNPAYLPCPDPYHPMFLSESMLREFGRDPDNELPASFIDQALSNADECHGIVTGGTLAAYGWYSRRPTRIDPPDLVLHHGNEYVYMYKGFTHPGHRGKRLHAIGMTLALQHYLVLGFKGLVSYVESNNFRSLNSVFRMGFVTCGTIHILKILGVLLTHGSTGCTEYGVRIDSAMPGFLPTAAALPGGPAR